MVWCRYERLGIWRPLGPRGVVGFTAEGGATAVVSTSTTLKRNLIHQDP
jgi:hypothetical protein